MNKRERPTHAEKSTALYRWFDADGTLLYVGVSFDLGTRFASHRYGNDNWQQVRRIELEWFDNRRAALEAEARAIATEDPMWNAHQGIFMKDLQASGRVRLRAVTTGHRVRGVFVADRAPGIDS